jgi:hypothetical protein
MLYNYPKDGVTNYGIKPSNELLREKQSEVSDIGMTTIGLFNFALKNYKNWNTPV